MYIRQNLGKILHDEDVIALFNLAKASHPEFGMHTNSTCVCGNATGPSQPLCRFMEEAAYFLAESAVRSESLPNPKCGRCGDELPGNNGLCYECVLMESQNPIEDAMKIIEQLIEDRDGIPL